MQFLRPLAGGQRRFGIAMLAEILDRFAAEGAVFRLSADVVASIALQDLQRQFLATLSSKVAESHSSCWEVIRVYLSHRSHLSVSMQIQQDEQRPKWC